MRLFDVSSMIRELIRFPASIIAMIVVGCVVLCLFIAWDSLYAKYPICPSRFLKNRAFQAAMWISFFDFVSVVSSD